MTPRHITLKGGKTGNNENREFDSDRNDDPGREMQLDRSFDDWVANSIEERNSQMQALTHVPNDNVIDVADDMDEG